MHIVKTCRIKLMKLNFSYIVSLDVDNMCCHFVRITIQVCSDRIAITIIFAWRNIIRIS